MVKKYLLIIGLLLSIFGMTNLVFSKEPIDTFGKIERKEEKIEFARNLTLRQSVLLASQLFDKYDSKSIHDVAIEDLGSRWQVNPSTIPETISIVLNEKSSPEWKVFFIDGFFKRTHYTFVINRNKWMLSPFLSYIEDKSKDAKTKIVLLDIIGCWVEGYKDNFVFPESESFKTKENFEIVNKHIILIIDSLNKIILNVKTPKDVVNSAKVLYSKIRQIYLDEDNVLPQELQNLKSFQQVKAKTETVIIGDLSKHLREMKSIIPAWEKVKPIYKPSVQDAIKREFKIVYSVRTQEKVYFSQNNKYTDKWEDISANIDLTKNKYFITPPTITASGNGHSAIFKATIKGSGEAEGMTVSIDQRGSVVVTGL